MRIYEVGGAVRDRLLGRPVSDRDWVVVGATPEQMVAAGFRPVGKDFPVFLHPQTSEEYALARTERKTAPGYKGFVFHHAPDVTLEEDLRRRDLTINAMARDAGGTLIDPCGGQRDLEARVLRHVSAAFGEDPVRVLRVARFAARFADFSVAPATMALMRRMVEAGEVDALVAERVWQELARGLVEARPSRMFEVLRACGALARIVPELDRLWGVPQPEHAHPEIDTGVHAMQVIDYAAGRDFPLGVRFAALVHDLGKGDTPSDEWPRHVGHEARSVELVRQVCARLRVPGEVRDLALLAAGEHGVVHRALELTPPAVVRLVERTDALRRPQRFVALLQACEADYLGRPGFGDRPYPQATRLLAALAACQAVDAGAIARELRAPGAAAAAADTIRARVHQARVHAVRAALGA